MNLTAVEVDDDWYRLIPSRFPPVEIYERVASKADLPAVFAIENLTNPRLKERKVITQSQVPADCEPPTLQNWNHAPFAYRNPEGGWFIPANEGGLELGDSLQTALAVSVRKRELFLSRTDESATSLDMRVISVRVQGTFTDARDLPLEMSQADRWAVGQQLLDDDANGVLYRCPVRPSATCLAVLDNRVMEKSVQREHFKFVWDGQRISRLYDFAGGVAIEAANLFGEEPAIAA